MWISDIPIFYYAYFRIYKIKINKTNIKDKNKKK